MAVTALPALAWAGEQDHYVYESVLGVPPAHGESRHRVTALEISENRLYLYVWRIFGVRQPLFKYEIQCYDLATGTLLMSREVEQAGRSGRVSDIARVGDELWACAREETKLFVYDANTLEYKISWAPLSESRSGDPVDLGGVAEVPLRPVSFCGIERARDGVYILMQNELGRACQLVSLDSSGSFMRLHALGDTRWGGAQEHQTWSGLSRFGQGLLMPFTSYNRETKERFSSVRVFDLSSGRFREDLPEDKWNETGEFVEVWCLKYHNGAFYVVFSGGHTVYKRMLKKAFPGVSPPG